MPKVINKISSAAVKKATGKSWDEWIRILDKEGADKLTHKEIARILYEKYLKKGWPASNALRSNAGWWSQMVTVGYEYVKCKRIVGQTESVGFEIGVQKMFKVPPQKVWKKILSREGLSVWLGKLEDFKLKNCFSYETKEGTSGEIRTFKKEEKIRLTWKPKSWDKPSTLQISLFCPRNTKEKTNLRFHQENLESVEVRSKVRAHWQSV